MSGGYILTVFTFAPCDEGGWGRKHHTEERVNASEVNDRRRFWERKGFEVEVEPW